MSFQQLLIRAVLSASTLGIIAVSNFPAYSQAVTAPVAAPMSVAERNNLYCAGYVQTAPIDISRRLIGAVDEQDGFLYAENELIYINVGANRGIKAGDVMSVLRPRGQVRSEWSRKGSLGAWVQEVGAIEIVRVKADHAAARVTTSCSAFLLGDLVQPWQARTSPAFVPRPNLDIFADPTGKAMGRIVLSRDGSEMVSRDQIVYVDLGAEDNVRIGDYLTIFRPLGKGNLLDGPSESVTARSYGYKSEVYKGGEFSNQSARKSGDQAKGRVVTTPRAKRGRPDIRKVVGEGVILNVKERVATVVITRTAQEIHTGDWVEVQ